MISQPDLAHQREAIPQCVNIESQSRCLVHEKSLFNARSRVHPYPSVPHHYPRVQLPRPARHPAVERLAMPRWL